MGISAKRWGFSNSLSLCFKEKSENSYSPPHPSSCSQVGSHMNRTAVPQHMLQGWLLAFIIAQNKAHWYFCLWHMMSFLILSIVLSFKIFFKYLFYFFSDYNAPFAQWSTERVCNWLEDFGLGQYVIFARQWVTSGHTLLTATPQDMEKVTICNCFSQASIPVDSVQPAPF